MSGEEGLSSGGEDEEEEEEEEGKGDLDDFIVEDGKDLDGVQRLFLKEVGVCGPSHTYESSFSGHENKPC